MYSKFFFHYPLRACRGGVGTEFNIQLGTASIASLISALFTQRLESEKEKRVQISVSPTIVISVYSLRIGDYGAW